MADRRNQAGAEATHSLEQPTSQHRSQLPRRRVLVVLLGVPVPPDTGYHLRQVAILRLVRALGCETHALVFTTDDRPNIPEEMHSLCDAVRNAGPRREYRNIRPFRRLALRLGMVAPAILRRPGRTYPFSIPYDQAGAELTIRCAIEDVKPDAVVLPTILLHSAPMIRSMGAKVIGDAADILSQLTRRVLSYSQKAPWRLPGLLVNHLATLHQEAFFFDSCDEMWVTSNGEKDFFRRRLPHIPVIVAGNTVETPDYSSPTEVVGNRIGFIGNYSLAPNLEAACFLAEQVLPTIRQVNPSVRLALAGDGMPTDTVNRLSSIPGVDLLGRVADSATFMLSCRVLALPVRVRAGVPIKLIEALACARPIVVTHEIAQGLSLRHGIDLLIADDADGCAKYIHDVLVDDDLAARLGRQGRDRFESLFSYGAMLKQLQLHSLLADHRSVS